MKYRIPALLLLLVVIIPLGAHGFAMDAAFEVKPEQVVIPDGRSLLSQEVVIKRDYNGTVRDTYFYDNENPPTAHGGDDVLKVREATYNGGRSLLHFDLTSADIPVGATVTEAYLDLFVGYRSPSSPAPVTLHQMLVPWDEANATWDVTGMGGNWAAPGAGGEGTDYEATPFASVSVDQTSTYYRIDVRDGVSEWVAHPESNHGFVMRGSSIDLRFRSSEWWIENERPRLTVVYELPPDYTPPPTYTPTPTWTPTPAPSATPTVAAIVTSFGVAEAFPPDDLRYEETHCVEAGPLPTNPDHMEVLLVWQGVATQAKLSFKYSGNNAMRHSIKVNGQTIGQVPGDNYHTVCSGGSDGELFFDPSLVLNGMNTISIVDDAAPGETSSWSLYDPVIHLGGYVQSTGVRVVETISSYDGTTQRGIVQTPIGHSPGMPLPLVVGLHGWGGRDYDTLTWLAQACSDRGWLLACSDTRNSNQHTASEAVQHDIVDLIQYVVNSPDYTVDESRIYLVGNSMGAMMAATTACKYPDRFAALVEMRGPTSLNDWYYERTPDQQATIAGEIGGPPNANYFFDYRRRSAGAMPMNLRNVPLAILHGTSDTVVNYAHATNLRDALVPYVGAFEECPTDPGFDYIFCPYDGGHGDAHPTWDEDRITAFLNEHVLDPIPRTVTVRTDEPKGYYWLTIGYSNAEDHWTNADATYDPESDTVTIEVYDERSRPIVGGIDYTIDLAAIGLPTHTEYTVEDLNLTTGSYSQYTVAATTSLVLNVAQDRHRMTAYPATAPSPQTIALKWEDGVYEGVVDTYLDQYIPAANYGHDSLRLSTGRTPLVRFDLTILPPGIDVKGAQLGFYTSWGTTGAVVNTSLHRVLVDWDVNQATWNERLTGQPWTSAGANGAGEDYDPASHGSQSFDSTGARYWYNATDLVRGWIERPADNHGVLLRGVDGGTGNYSVNSSEAPSYQPELVIQYAYPTVTPTPTQTATPTVTRTPFLTPTWTPLGQATPSPSPTTGPTDEYRVHVPLVLK